MSANGISAENLSFAYRDENGINTVLHNLQFDFAPGEFVCIIEHSGCGKSTLLKILAGLLKPTSGNAYLDGKPLEGPGSDRMIMFQKYSVFPWMKVRKNVAYGVMHAENAPSKQRAWAIADDFLEKVGMAEYAGYYPYQLSGGMQQRVALARALAMDTDTLLLDEPFGALDARMRTELQGLLCELWAHSDRKRTIVFVTHDIDEALILSDRIIFMEKGRIKNTLRNELARPRALSALQRSERYLEMKQSLVDLFYDERPFSEEGLS